MPHRHHREVTFSRRVLFQLCILCLCRFAEPLALTSIFPYLYYMIKSFGIPESDISFYAGLTASAFSIAQFLTGIAWGRMSDITGRKPLILLGLMGTMMSMLMFGFSTNIYMAISARLIAGLVNGNVGILRTVVAELVPERELQPRAFSIMPLVWNIASVIGPIIGGALADPITNHPDLFGKHPPWLLVKFPFILPSLVVSVCFLIGAPIGFLFLEETLETKKGRRDVGRELGDRLIKCCFGRRDKPHNSDDERASLLSASSSSSSDEEIITNGPPVPERNSEAVSPQNETPPLMAAFTFQSSMNIIFYAFLALHSIAFDQLLPIFLSYPEHHKETHDPPLKFAGGFGLQSGQVGWIFSFYGAACMLLQLFLYPPIVRALGALPSLRLAAYLFPICYFLVPFLVLVPLPFKFPALYVVMAIKGFAAVLAFPTSTILLTNSSPTLRLLGTLNGIAVAVAALGRAFGPSMGGLIFSQGMKTGYGVLPWWVLTAITILGAIPAVFMVDRGHIGDATKLDTEEADIEEEADTHDGYGAVKRVTSHRSTH